MRKTIPKVLPENGNKTFLAKTNILMRNLLITMLICWVSFGYSQDFEAGLYFGGSFYSGDLSPKAIPEYTNFIEPAGGLVARIRGRGVVAARISIMYTHLWGDDRKGAVPDRGLSFKTKLTRRKCHGRMVSHSRQLHW